MFRSLKVAHLTSVHGRYDTRIFLKECTSLAKHKYEVCLVVADGKGDEHKNNVSIIDAGASKGRIERISKAPGRIDKIAVELDAQIYHLHDPELIPIGVKLKKLGKIVVFDAHEDVPKQLLGKPYLDRSTRFVLSKCFSAYEKWACPKLDAVIGATPFIRDKYLGMHLDSVDVNNYPLLGELSSEAIDWSRKKSQICYVGGVAAIRGIYEMVSAMQYVKADVRLQVGGTFSEKSVERAVKSSLGWNRVDELGWLNRAEVAATLKQSVAGLVTLHPTINYMDALPVKMFEYMSAGVPVIASNFPLWREIIEGNDCGLCVDPLDPRAIAEAINFLVNNPARAEQMGRNGQCAVNERYNWDVEERKLLALYASLI